MYPGNGSIDNAEVTGVSRKQSAFASHCKAHHHHYAHSQTTAYVAYQYHDQRTA